MNSMCFCILNHRFDVIQLTTGYFNGEAIAVKGRIANTIHKNFNIFKLIDLLGQI